MSIKLHTRKRTSGYKPACIMNESQLLRVQLRRYLEAETVALDQMNYGTRLQALRAFNLAAVYFNRLVRTQAILDSKPIGSENVPEGTPQRDEPVPGTLRNIRSSFVPLKQIACFVLFFLPTTASHSRKTRT